MLLLCISVQAVDELSFRRNQQWQVKESPAREKFDDLAQATNMLNELGLSGLSGQSEDELTFRKRLKAQVQHNLMQERFDDLEQTARIFRDYQTRTSSGIWTLTQFYFAFNDLRLPDEASWVTVEQKFKRWEAKFPFSPTPVIAHAAALTGRGWRQWEQQQQKKANKQWMQAHALLTQSRSFASKDPAWFEKMLATTCAQEWTSSEYEEILAEGTRRYPAYYQNYFAGLAFPYCKTNALPLRLEVMASRAAAVNMVTDGDGLYARIYWYAAQAFYGDRLFQETMVDWPRMKKSMDDVLNQYPDQWNINNFAYFACLKGDKVKAHTLLSQVTTPIMDVWDSEERFQQCRHWANQGVKSA